MSKSDGLNRRGQNGGTWRRLYAYGEPSQCSGANHSTVWTVRLNTPELAVALKSILADFEAENPGIKVRHEPVSGNLVYPKFLTAIRGQSMPDVAEAYSYHPLQFAAVDKMEPLDDIIDTWKQERAARRHLQ